MVGIYFICSLPCPQESSSDQLLPPYVFEAGCPREIFLSGVAIFAQSSREISPTRLNVALKCAFMQA